MFKIADNKVMRIFLCIFLGLTITASVTAFEKPSSFLFREFPENTDVRQRLSFVFFASIKDALLVKSGVWEQNISNQQVLFEIQNFKDAFYLLFRNQQGKIFPLYSKGSWVIKRSHKDGTIVQAKVFLTNQEHCFARIFPFKDRSRMDVVLYGKTLYQNINLPLGFSALLTRPFSEIMYLTAKTVQWGALFPINNNEPYTRLSNMVHKISLKLSQLHYREDGCIDSAGRYVFIESLEEQQGLKGLNCSGFVKWIADGIYYPVHGKFLDIRTIKQKHEEDRGNSFNSIYEDKRDPYFALDWSENIALAIQELQNPSDYLRKKGITVKEAPFFPSSKHSGYLIEDAYPLQYLLAIEEPGYFYLASISTKFGKDPSLTQYRHLAAFFPHFDRNGVFQLTVFENTEQSSIQALQQRFPHSRIHLVRICAPEEYDP